MATTTSGRHTGAATPVGTMPPLHVTTRGIPGPEHVRDVDADDELRRARWHRQDLVVWTVAIVVVGLFFAALAALAPAAAASDVHQGLDGWAWNQYRSGERSTAVVTPTPTQPASPFGAPPMTALPPLGS